MWIRSALARPFRRAFRPIAVHWPWPVATKLADGTIMYVDLRSAIGRGIMMKGEFDSAIWHALEPHLADGDVLLDVGCNIGYYTILASKKVGLGGEVHAFDVDPRPLRCLRKTLRKNAVENVIVHGYALGECPKTSTLATSSESGLTSLSAVSTGRRVPVLPLDAWAEYFKTKRVAAIKIDVEGHDLNVLKGCVQILRTHRPAVVCEGNPTPEHSDRNAKDEISEFLSGMGYCGQTLPAAINKDILFVPR